MTSGPSRAVKLCGTEATDAPTRRLSAGKLSVELENGQLRYVRFAGVEALRAVAFLVRDANWGTYAPEIEDLAIKETGDGFAVAYRAVCADSRQKLAYEARITGASDGSLAFDAVMAPETDFVTNRAGFVVLHPAGLAGQRLKVTHVDGSEEETRFPERISPSQPVFDIRALAHEAAPGLWATCLMEGDAFEMEDQRNWTDASYKTYVRPLALPWGYTLARGSRHEQSVRLSFAGAFEPRRAHSARPATVRLARTLAQRCLRSVSRCRRRRLGRRWRRSTRCDRSSPLFSCATSICATAAGLMSSRFTGGRPKPRRRMSSWKSLFRTKTTPRRPSPRSPPRFRRRG